jgi:predicted RNA methylase
MLEQYPTSPHLAARIVFNAFLQGDIEGRSVCDLGCGTGMLAIASQVLGASYTTGFDISTKALAIARQNVDEMEVDVEFVHCDVSLLPTVSGRSVFDTVIMNPPFGTRVKGIDMVFLEKALELASTAVYSLHKTSTRDFIVKKATALGVKVTVMAELKFDIPAMYKFHKKKSMDVQVDLIRFEKIKPKKVKVKKGSKDASVGATDTVEKTNGSLTAAPSSVTPPPVPSIGESSVTPDPPAPL